jgi:hypothetical protein
MSRWLRPRKNRKTRRQRGGDLLETQNPTGLKWWIHQGSRGETPLMRWARGVIPLTDEQLDSLKDRVNEQDPNHSRTALMFACRSNQPLDVILGKVQKLLSMGANKDLLSDDVMRDGKHVRLTALDYFNEYMSDSSREHFRDVDTTKSAEQIRTALSTLQRGGALFQNQIKPPTFLAGFYLTELMYWAMGARTDTNLDDPRVRASINQTDSRNNRTALIYACRSHQPFEVILTKVEKLLAMGADVCIESSEKNYDDPFAEKFHYTAFDYIHDHPIIVGTYTKREEAAHNKIMELLTNAMVSAKCPIKPLSKPAPSNSS